MNDLDTVLRDALDARVARVAHDPDAYSEILRRRARRRLTRWVRPIGAVAATAAVVGLLAVVVRAPHTDHLEPAGGVPRRVVTGRHLSADAFEVAVVGADDLAGRPVARMAAPAGLGTLRAVAATGDDRTFYAAWESIDDCRSRLYRLSAPSGDATRVLDVTGDVTGLAVSPDGRRLAYAMWADGPGTSICGGTDELHVRDLASGQDRVWATRSAGALRIYSITGLTWSPDGRYVAFGLGDQEVRRIDTTAAPGTIAPLPPDPFTTNVDESGLPPAGTTCFTATPAYLPTGELVAAYRCVDNRTQAAERTRLVVLDPDTRRPGRTLLTYPAGTAPRWLAIDPTGAHALIGVARTSADVDTYQVYRSDNGSEPRLVLDGDAARSAIDW